MRTTTGNRWVWLFAGALPALSLGAGCGDDTTGTTTTSGGGFGGFGEGGDPGPGSTASTGVPATSNASTSQSNASSSASQGSGGEGAGDTGGSDPGSGGAGGGTGGDPGQGGGGGEPVGCTTDDDCDDVDTDCRDYTCNLDTNECTDFTNINENGLVGTDETDDCSDLRCVAGVATLVDDDTETPEQLDDDCTVEVCDGGEVVSEPDNEGNACGDEGGECLGGNCVECSDRSDCPADTDCRTWACSNDNECVPTDEPPGTLIESGPLNDCVSLQCDEDAEATMQPDDTETPDEDTNECTVEGAALCQDGEAFYPNEPDGTPCTDGGVECTVGVCGAATLLVQSFDALPTAGTPSLADFATALDQGWAFANDNDAARIGDGSSNSGGIYNFGASGSNDRALGGLASGGTLTQAWGVCFTNDTGAATGVTVSYDGEQWRDGGNASLAAHSLSFSFTTFFDADSLAANVGATATGDSTTGWQNVAALDFTSPVTAVEDAGAVDGNTDGLVAISALLPGLSLADGESACVRWLDINDAGNDHGLAIDNLVITGDD